MWKFVTRRFKDTVERTYNVLDVRQTWTCGVDSKRSKNSSAAAPEATNTDTCDELCTELYIWRCGDSKYNKRKSSQRDQYFHDDFNRCYGRHTSYVTNAVATTLALLSGFYLSQMISLGQRRRHLRHLDAQFNLHLFDQNGAQSQNKFGKNYCLLTIAKSVYEKSFVPSDKRQNCFVPTDTRHLESIYRGVNLSTFNRPVPVNNDHTKDEKDRNDHVVEAIENLMQTLGNIEFKLGLQNIQANEHKVAVSHFKLATTHRHAGATFNLGVCYELGIGVDKNMRSAMECYRAAAALGHKKAMYNLGVFYARGEGGLTKNREAAAACLLAADKLGLQSARTVFDVPKDMRKPDDEIHFKTTKLAIEDVHKTQLRPFLFG